MKKLLMSLILLSILGIIPMILVVLISKSTIATVLAGILAISLIGKELVKE